MDKPDFNRLIDRYLDGSASAADRKLLEAYYEKFAEGVYPNLTSSQMEELEPLMYARILNGLDDVRRDEPKANKRTITLWSRIAVAVAAAVATITLSIWIYRSSVIPNLFQDPEAVAATQDIAPGKNTATLTLANGKTIQLSDAKSGVVIDASNLKYIDGSAVDPSLRGGTTKQSHPEIASSLNDPRNDLEVSTPRGGMYQIVLADGTKVWLNAASSLKFPSKFIGSERTVQLTGEGYFEVASSYTSLRGRRTKQSFIVQTQRQQVEVLGTHFNINSYPDEPTIQTTLLEGSVRVSYTPPRAERRPAARNSRVDREVVLKPGQQSLNDGQSLKVIPADLESVTDWKEGDFIFNQEPLSELMRSVSRWYDVKVVYSKEVDQSQTFSGKVSRQRNITQVLKALQTTQALKFKISGNTVYVSN